MASLLSFHISRAIHDYAQSNGLTVDPALRDNSLESMTMKWAVTLSDGSEIHAGIRIKEPAHG